MVGICCAKIRSSQFGLTDFIAINEYGIFGIDFLNTRQRISYKDSPTFVPRATPYNMIHSCD